MPEGVRRFLIGVFLAAAALAVGLGAWPLLGR